ncbi:MAG: endolytic transglycosylase MltG [Comamonadaceae bacterium]|nr:endolytic transglycosylase MltG [Comamonadaceae bacterium]
MRLFLKLLAAVLLLAAAAAAAGWWWAGQPLRLAAPRVEMSVPPGASPRVAAQQAVAGGVRTQAEGLHLFFRVALWQAARQGQRQSIKPGDYAVTQGMTPRDLLAKLVRGDRILLGVTFVEGWTFRQIRAALAKAEHLRPDTASMTPEAIMAALGKPGLHPEGRFFPDTYHYAKHTSDLAVLRQSMQLMERRLQAAWDARAPGVPLKSADEALILASIVEKETGLAADRAQVAGVFTNRLKIGMRLQTDPTVIYGLGEAFDGNLRRRDLQTDTPYNTYTRAGLPPTPIAMPGSAALMAAVQPADTPALYFVARGDGSSQFSRSLDEHNRAVNQYQRNAK